MLLDLFTRIQQGSVSGLYDWDDRVLWAAESDGRFSVRSLYMRMNAPPGPVDHCVSVIWSSLAPPKARFLCWLAWLKRVKCVCFGGVLKGLFPIRWMVYFFGGPGARFLKSSRAYSLPFRVSLCGSSGKHGTNSDLMGYNLIETVFWRKSSSQLRVASGPQMWASAIPYPA
ncbi:hypothetical protein Dimus_027182 [Dionaea muscipula]